MNNHRILFATLLLLALAFAARTRSVAADRPNILWITIEDWGPYLSCYGTEGISTPHVDKLASEGIRYERAFTTAPVCSTSRSAMMTGFHQNYIGAQQHRELNKKPLPYGIKPIPHLMAEAGYYAGKRRGQTQARPRLPTALRSRLRIRRNQTGNHRTGTRELPPHTAQL